VALDSNSRLQRAAVIAVEEHGRIFDGLPRQIHRLRTREPWSHLEAINYIYILSKRVQSIELAVLSKFWRPLIPDASASEGQSPAETTIVSVPELTETVEQPYASKRLHTVS